MDALPKPVRLGSLDMFRGFVILSMVFVNAVAGVSGIPGWMKHAPGDADLYTFADIVFPAFLFIVGASIPFSLGRRLEAGEGAAGLWRRVLPRVLSLVFLGVVMVGADGYDAQAAPLPAWAWTLLFYFPFFALWRDRPLPRGVRLICWALLGLALAAFRGPDGGWFTPQWWGILGIIGWAYLAAAAVYIGGRGRNAVLWAAWPLMLGLYEAGRAGWFSPALDPLLAHFDLGGLWGTHAALVVLGILAGGHLKKTEGRGWLWLAAFGVVLLALGYLCRPLRGFSKIQGTIPWALVCAGWSGTALALFVWGVEIKGRVAAAAWLLPVGVNPLLAYLLPGVASAALSACGALGLNLWGWVWPFWNGWAGVANAGLWTVLMMALTAWFTRRRWILKM